MSDGQKHLTDFRSGICRGQGVFARGESYGISSRERTHTSAKPKFLELRLRGYQRDNC